MVLVSDTACSVCATASDIACSVCATASHIACSEYSVDIQKTRYKKLFTHVESHASAVSLLESAE